MSDWVFCRSKGLLAREKFGFGHILSSIDSVKRRVNQIERTYTVVRFKVLRAADGCESRVRIADLATSLWTGTVAASAVEATASIMTAEILQNTCIIY